MKRTLLVATTLFAFSFFQVVQSQCLLYEVPLEQRIQKSDLIVEGEILQSVSFWDNVHQLIYTSHLVDVYKVFDGNVTGSQIEIITQGGRVGNDLLIVNPSSGIKTGDIGVFFLEYPLQHQPQFAGAAGQVYSLYSGAQGIVKYNNIWKTASDHFAKYADITNDLHPYIISKTNQTIQVIQPIPVVLANSNRGGGPTITSITPDTVRAGTNDVIQIRGADFTTNSNTALVEFPDANSGGFFFRPASSAHILNWTDTLIEVVVPGDAGTGIIQVTDDIGNSTLSPDSLFVRYNLLSFPFGNPEAPVHLVDLNTNGGLTYQYNVDFAANQLAVDAFERALQNWRCNTLINYDVAGTATNVSCQGSDNTNLVAFSTDTSCLLSAGVLGTSFSFYNACGIPPVWYLENNDVVFDSMPSFPWNYGPQAPGLMEFDFESVALHELGHSHQIGHVIDSTKVMHFTLTNGDILRLLDPPSDIAAGLQVMSQSTEPRLCGPNTFVPLTPGTCALHIPIANFNATPKSGCASLTVQFVDLSASNPTFWFWDFENDGIVDDMNQNPQHTYTTPGTYSIKLIVANTNGNDTMVRNNFITVDPVPVADAGAPKTICGGDNVNIGGSPSGSGGTGTLTYLWTPSTGLSSSTVANPQCSATQTTDYTLIVSDQNGCADTTTVLVTVNPAPIASAGPNKSICAGETVQIGGNPTGSGGTGTLTYLWTPAGILNASTIPNPISTPVVTTVHTVIVTDQLGCSASDTMTVFVNANPVVDAGSPVGVCENDSVTIGGSPSASGGAGGYTYLWQPFAGLGHSGIANPKASPLVTTNYTLHVFDAIGCQDSNMVMVTVNPIPTVDGGSDKQKCCIDTIQIGGNPTVSGGMAPYSYLWTPSFGLLNPSDANPFVDACTTTIYSLTVTDANNCGASTNVKVTVFPNPVANAGPDTGYCPGGDVEIGGFPSGSGGSGPLTYSWSPLNGLNDPADPNPIATPISPVRYFLTVTDSIGCKGKSDALVSPGTNPVANAGQDTAICLGTCLIIGGNPTASSGTPPYIYSWSPAASLNSPSLANPTACPSVLTCYVVLVIDDNGCTDTDTVCVDILPLPNASIDTLRPIICVDDDPLNLSGAPTGGVFSGTGVAGNQFNPSLAGAGSHIIQYVVTDANGCEGSAFVTANVVPLPVKPTIVQTEDTLSTQLGYVSYEWVFNGIPVFDSDTTHLFPNVSGMFEVIVFDTNGCSNRSEVHDFWHTKVSEIKGLNSVDVYPNPVNDHLFLRITSDGIEKLNLRILDIQGREIMLKQFAEIPKILNEKIILPTLASGIYIIQLFNKDGIYYKEILIE